MHFWSCFWTFFSSKLRHFWLWIDSCSRFKKTWLLKTDQYCLVWGNMEYIVASLRLPWGFGIPVGSKLKWPQEMESHWARLTWEYSMLFQNSLVRFKIPDPQIVFHHRKCQKTKQTKNKQIKKLTDKQNKTKQNPQYKASTMWLICSLGVEETWVYILKPTWAQLFLKLTSWCNHVENDHLKAWRCRYSGLLSICSDLTDLGIPRHLDF